VEIAAFNARRSVTISGPADAVSGFCQDSGLRTQQLTVSHAFHSASMQGAVEPFVQAITERRLAAPVIGFASTVTGGWHTAETATDPEYWGRAIREPVRFSQAVAALSEIGVGSVWEIGSHPQLTSLARASWGETQPVWLSTLRRDRTDQVQLHAALAAYVNQTPADLNWAGLHQGTGRRTATIPTYPFNRQRFWISSGPPETTSNQQHESNHKNETKRHLNHG
ncbi:acyltransferase domain-containing protein, partial [Streptomyces sp. NPDC006645]